MYGNGAVCDTTHRHVSLSSLSTRTCVRSISISHTYTASPSHVSRSAVSLHLPPEVPKAKPTLPSSAQPGAPGPPRASTEAAYLPLQDLGVELGQPGMTAAPSSDPVAQPHVFTHASIIGIGVRRADGSGTEEIVVFPSPGSFGDWTFNMSEHKVAMGDLGPMEDELVLCLHEERAKLDRASQYKWPDNAKAVHTWAHGVQGAAAMLRSDEMLRPSKLLEKAASSADTQDMSAVTDINAMLSVVHARFESMVMCAEALKETSGG